MWPWLVLVLVALFMSVFVVVHARLRRRYKELQNTDVRVVVEAPNAKGRASWPRGCVQKTVYRNIPCSAPKVWFIIIHTPEMEVTKRAMQDTWLSDLPATWRYDFIIGGSKSLIHDSKKHVIVAPCEEVFGNILQKTLLAFRYMLNSDWDFCIRTNNGTYYNPQILQDFLSTRDRTCFAGNVIYNHTHYRPYIMGWNMIMGRQVVRDIVEKGTYYRKPDDVYLSHTARHCGYEYEELERVAWIKQKVETLPTDALAYRLTEPLGYERTLRINKFYSLHKYLEKKKSMS
jgi:hypothetical protein